MTHKNDDYLEIGMSCLRTKSRFRTVGVPLIAGILALVFGFGVNAYLPLIKLPGKFLRYAESRDATGNAAYYPLFALEYPPGTRVVKAASGSRSPHFAAEKTYPLLCVVRDGKIVRAETFDGYLAKFFYVLFPRYGFAGFAGLFFLAAFAGWRKNAARP